MSSVSSSLPVPVQPHPVSPPGSISPGKRLHGKSSGSGEEAARKVERVNTGRANHYRRYTGRQWTDIGEYDLVVNTDRVGIDGAVDTILRASKDLK